MVMGRDPRVVKDSRVPKRFRCSRRDLPNGQVRRWDSSYGKFKTEREAKLSPKVGDDFGQTYATPEADWQPDGHAIFSFG